MSIAVVLFVIQASGCASSGTNSSAQATTSEQGAADGLSMVERARQDGADESQLVLLENADIPFADYEQAVQRTIDCIRSAGIEVIGGEVTESRGFPMINYSFAGSSDGRTNNETLTAADSCIGRYSFWVEAAYQTSPLAVELQDAAFDEVRPALLDCLRQNGAELSEDAGQAEILTAVTDLLAADGDNCLAAVGLAP